MVYTKIHRFLFEIYGFLVYLGKKFEQFSFYQDLQVSERTEALKQTKLFSEELRTLIGLYLLEKAKMQGLIERHFGNDGETEMFTRKYSVQPELPLRYKVID